MDAEKCCQILLGDQDSTVKSPFSKMIVLDWFDGPTYGVVQCSQCEANYIFSTLTADDGSYEFSSWDKGKEIYIYGLSHVTPKLHERIISILSETEPPQWPIWHRATYKDFPRRDEYLRVDADVMTLLSEVNDIEVVIAVHMFDLLEEILKSRTVTPDILENTKEHQWFSFLGYVKPA
jgi:hypothetical protein